MNRHRGFSFAEVMFAVVILGVGFIMVAAIFPVAAQQTRSTNDQAVATQLAQVAFKTIESSTTAEDYPADANNLGMTHSYGDGGSLGPWAKLTGSMICPSDRRYAWVPFYCRPTATGPINVTIVVVRRSLKDAYSTGDADLSEGELVPRGIQIQQIVQGDGSQVAVINRDNMGCYQSIGPGAFLVVTQANDVVGGHVLQVSELLGETSDTVSWRLTPGYGLNPGDTCGSVTAAVIGKEPVNPQDLTAGVGGSVQDVSIFTAMLNPK